MTGIGSPTRETCAGCDAPLAEDQRFCLGCGLRCSPDALRLAALPLMGVPPASARRFAALPRRPVVRSAAITAVVVLTMGVAIGAAIGPAAVGQTRAAQSPLLVVSTTPATPEGDEALTGAAVDDATREETSPVEQTADLPIEPAPDEPLDEAPVAAAVPPASAPAGERTPGEAETPADGSQQAAQDAPPPGSGPLAGFVVVAAADRFTVADREGALREVHATGCGVQAGDDLHLRTWQLANGTWTADRVRRLPRPAPRRVVVATVTWVDPVGSRYALGARGVTLLVATPQPAAVPPTTTPDQMPGASPSAAAVLPAVGERVRVAFDQPTRQPAGDPPATLLERRRTVVPIDPETATTPPSLELRGRVATVDPQARTISLVLDVADPATTTVTLGIPERIEPAAILSGQDAAVTAARTADGYVLTGISNDTDANAADDISAVQGDQPTTAAQTRDEAATTLTTTCTLLQPRRPA